MLDQSFLVDVVFPVNVPLAPPDLSMVFKELSLSDAISVFGRHVQKINIEAGKLL